MTTDTRERLQGEGGDDMQEREPRLQRGEDLKKDLGVLPSWGKTGQLLIA